MSGAWAAVGAGEFLIQLLIEEGLSLEQLHDEDVLSIDDLHHLGGHTKVWGVIGGEIGFWDFQLTKGGVSLQVLRGVVHHAFVV